MGKARGVMEHPPPPPPTLGIPETYDEGFETEPEFTWDISGLALFVMFVTGCAVGVLAMLPLAL